MAPVALAFRMYGTIMALNAIQKVKRKLCQKLTGLMFIDALDAEQSRRMYDVADKTQCK